MNSKLKDAITTELAFCRHVDKSVSETAARIYALVTQGHDFWCAGEPDCPSDIKAGNGELHTLRCRFCGTDNPRDNVCIPEGPAS